MSRDVLTKILDLARWAPSGDNTQPWRFEIVADDHIAVHGFDTREHVIYDFDGHPSQMAHGALIETLRITASGFQLKSEWGLRAGSPDNAPVYDIFLKRSPDLLPDPLLPYIEKRVVQRRPMRLTPLTAEQRNSLLLAPGAKYTVQFFEKTIDRIRVARLLWDNAHIRLTCPEAFIVHRKIIEWGVRFSKDRIPEGAVGVDPVTAKLMKWVMGEWERVLFFNRYLMGTIVPRIQLDMLPALFCGAHVMIRPVRPPVSLNDWVELGVAMQRLWLTASQHGLHLQPEMTPVIFRWYVQSDRQFSKHEALFSRALKLANDFEHLVGATRQESFGFFGRVGNSSHPLSRSVRQDLDFLLR